MRAEMGKGNKGGGNLAHSKTHFDDPKYLYDKKYNTNPPNSINNPDNPNRNPPNSINNLYF